MAVKLGRHIILVLLFVLSIQSIGNATIIFQDNFDTCTNNCNTCSGNDYWDQWTVSGGCSATYDSTTHYAGEISSAGRGGSGKAYKIWRHSTSWADPNFSGGLVKYLPGTYRDIWIRYYIRLPSAMNAGGSEYVKLWMLNPSGEEAIYVDLVDWGISTGRINLINYVRSPIDTVTLLNDEDTLAIRDGNWHCLQYHYNNTNGSSGTLQFYVDGVQKYSNTSYNWGSSSPWYLLQNFHIGNRGSTTQWQSSWQAMEIDDFIIATTKSETDPDGSSDTTAPTVSITQSSPQTITVDSLAISGTAYDAVWGTGSACKTRIVSAPDASNGTVISGLTYSGTVNWSATVSGFSVGANTLYVGCGDAAGNWTSPGQSITVYYDPSPRLISNITFSNSLPRQ